MADGQVVYEIRGDDAKLTGDLNRAEGVMRGSGRVWKSIGTAALSTVVAATGAVVSFGEKSIEAGAAFDTAMSQVAATMGLTDDEIAETGGAFEQLRDTAVKYGSETAFTATQCAEALNYMALAGYDAKTSIEMLPNVLSLAAAGTIDLAYASDMITDSQTALGLSLKETNVLVDQMAKASSKSNTSVSQLGEAILTVGGTAKYMSGGTEELNTVLGVLADNGIKGSEAGTHLRNMLLSLASPTDAASGWIEKLGLQVFNTDGELRTFKDIFGDLQVAMSDFTDEEKLQAFGDLFNTRDIAAANALLGTSAQRWDELKNEIVDSAGAAERMAATQLDNLNGDVTILKSALEGLQIHISDALTPSLREFVQFGTEGLDRLSAAFSEGGLEAALATLGDVLSDAVGYLVGYTPELVKAGMSLLGALARGIIDNLPEMLDAGIEAVLTLTDGLSSALPELIPAAVDIIFKLVDSLLDSGNIDRLIDAGIEILLALIDGILAALPQLIEKAPEIVIKLVKALYDNRDRLREAGIEIIKAILGGLLDAVPSLLSAGRDLMLSLWRSIFGETSRFSQVGEGLINGIWSGLSARWDWLTGKVRSLASSLLSAAKNVLGIHSPSTKARDEISGNIVKGLVAGLDENGEDAIKAARDLTSDMLSASTFTVRAGVDTSGVYSALDSVMGMNANISAGQAPVVVHNYLSGAIDVDGFEIAKITMHNLDDAASFTMP